MTQILKFSDITEEHVKDLLATIDKGLSKGLGVPIPGKMCIEAAICNALGLPHGDNPPCVGSAFRAFKIRLNDSQSWSSPAARAKGMRKLGFVQLGSDQLDQREFAKNLWKELQKEFPYSKRFTNAAAAYAADAADADAAAAYAADAAAAYAAYAADAAAAYAAADAAAAYAAAADKILTRAADACVRVAIAMNSPGCKWLYLCEEDNIENKE